ncbi:hypothetical protein MACJ_002675 [Theileria orientalis]|uniref:Cytidyltransferase-like domain-containing protein n=1 Tax=Theileria orientalis TaxID=68886 RepID=A0A976QSI1_THEOR|nr:hypothetical protein MACJ_002675 [Theileria orientalis]
MNVVLFDPDLSSLLAKARSSRLCSGSFGGLDRPNSLHDTRAHTINYTSDAHNTPEYGQSLFYTTNSTKDSSNYSPDYNLKCTIESNLNDISNLICRLICKISPLGVPKLNVYLLVENEFDLLSTILLNYIKSLYSLVVINSINHGFDHALEILLKIDLTILPICNFNSFKEVKIVDLEGIDTTDGNTITGKKFIYFKNSFICNEFYGYNSKNISTGPKISGTHGLTDAQQVLGGTGNIQDFVLYLRRFDNIMFCGTFDYLHYGHKLLLLAAFLSCNKNLSIGVVASDDLIFKKTGFEKIQPLETRKEMVKLYLNELQLLYPSTASFDNVVGTDSELGSSSSSSMYDYASIDFNLLNTNSASTAYHLIDSSPTYFDMKGNCSYSPHTVSSTANIRLDEMPTGNGVTINLFDLFDVVGPSNRLTEKFGLVVTPELIKNGQYVNEQRLRLNLVPWDLIVVGLVCYLKGDKLIKLSSSSIRSII